MAVLLPSQDGSVYFTAFRNFFHSVMAKYFFRYETLGQWIFPFRKSYYHLVSLKILIWLLTHPCCSTNFFYRLFTNLLLILASSIIPFLGLTWSTSILFLATSESSLAATVISRLSKFALWKSFSTKTSMSSTISEKDKGLITSTIAATCTLLLVKAVHGVPVVYELHSTVAMLVSF